MAIEQQLDFLMRDVCDYHVMKGGRHSTGSEPPVAQHSRKSFEV